MRANMQGTSRELSARVDCIASAIRVMRGRRRKMLQVFVTRSFAYGSVRMLQPLYGLRVVALIATVAAPAAHAMTELASTHASSARLPATRRTNSTAWRRLRAHDPQQVPRIA